MPGYELIGEEEKQAMCDIFDKYGGVLSRRGNLSRRNGSFKVSEFEKATADRLGIKYAQAVTSGTAALKTALIALGIKPGDEVITQSFTFVATVEAIVEVGAIPIVTDIDKTLNMDVSDLESKITKKTRAIIPVHMYGSAARMDKIMKIAKKHNLLVLEDAAQAFGATFQGRSLGSIGDIGALSFDFGKGVTTGEGGMVITDDKGFYERAREYSDHGHQDNPKFSRGEDTCRLMGFNFRMMELQGALGLVQLKKFDKALEKQRENKARIIDGISNIKEIELREFADKEGETGDSLIFFLKNKDKAGRFVKLLTEKNLSTKNLPDAYKWHFAGFWHQIFSKVEIYKNKRWENEWKKSSELLTRTVSMPIDIKMSDGSINHYIDSIREISTKL